jgi:acyl-coenzyme A synthetase/AMP-(fatty) acid ligase
VTHWILERLAEFENDAAIIWRDQQFSYGQLCARVGELREELKALGVQPGESVGIYGDYSPNTCMLLLAMIANGNIVVPLTSSMANHKESFLDIAMAGAVFDFANDDTWRFHRRAVAGEHPLLESLKAQQEPGLIVFSSGSTGEYKCSLHNFNKLLTKFQRRRHKLRALTFLLLDHLGGLNTLFYILSNGGTAISINDRSPRAVCEAIERYRVQLLPATPTFLNMLLISEVHKHYDLSSLEMITYGTEPMPATTLEALNKIFPGATLKQTYGLSEIGVLRTRSRDSHSLWVKVGGEGIETKVVDGTLRLRSQSAMLGYLNAPSPFDEEGWYNTQDEVEFDGEYIRFRGRKSEVINIAGLKVFPAEVENVLLQMGNVRDVVVWGKSSPVVGNVVAATVALLEPEDSETFELRMREFCREKLPQHQVPVIVKIEKGELHGDRFKKARNMDSCSANREESSYQYATRLQD